MFLQSGCESASHIFNWRIWSSLWRPILRWWLFSTPDCCTALCYFYQRQERKKSNMTVSHSDRYCHITFEFFRMKKANWYWEMMEHTRNVESVFWQLNWGRVLSTSAYSGLKCNKNELKKFTFETFVIRTDNPRIWSSPTHVWNFLHFLK